MTLSWLVVFVYLGRLIEGLIDSKSLRSFNRSALSLSREGTQNTAHRDKIVARVIFSSPGKPQTAKIKIGISTTFIPLSII
jgi:hypothetical protein